MRPSDHPGFDPDVLAELEAIDAVLRGEAVDPEYAEIAEVALLLAAEAPPAPSAQFTRELDARVERRFRPQPQPHRAGGRRRSLLGGWHRTAIAGAITACVIAAIVVIGSSTGGLQSGSSSGAFTGATSSPTPAVGTPSIGPGPTSGASTHGTASKAAATSAVNSQATTPSAKSPARASSGEFGTSGTLAPAAAPAAPNTSGRKVVQTAQIQLGASNERINQVSQELFDVVSAENGIVERSQVNSADGRHANSYATFSLSIPTGNFQVTMDRLSQLRYANVVSRDENTQDVTDTYQNDQHALRDAQALRISLLKQLESAYTQTAIDSIKAQIQTVERTIRGDQRRLNALQHSVSYTALTVQINAGDFVPVAAHHSSSFTLAGAAHDAGRVLVVAAGVILIGLAALVPLALILALAAWIAYWVRQRSRERALDQA